MQLTPPLHFNFSACDAPQGHLAVGAFATMQQVLRRRSSGRDPGAGRLQALGACSFQRSHAWDKFLSGDPR